MLKPFSLHGLSSLSLSFWLSIPLPVSHNSSSLSHISLIQSLHRCWVLDFGGWIGLDRWAGIGWSVGLNQWVYWSVGGSVGLIIGSSDGFAFGLGLIVLNGFAFGLGLIVCFLWIGLVWVWLFSDGGSVWFDRLFLVWVWSFGRADPRHFGA